MPILKPLWKNLPGIDMIYLYGASGHGKVILDILKESGREIGGFYDDKPNAIFPEYIPALFPKIFHFDSDELIISIGDNNIRKQLIERLKQDYPIRYGMAIHPKSILSSKITLMEGTVIMGGALINRDTQIGKHCIINSQASIDHDCHLDDYVHIAPGSVLCGNIQIGEGTLVGAGSTIIPNVTIGKNVIIGAGSIVIKSLPDDCIVVGNPARIIKTKK